MILFALEPVCCKKQQKNSWPVTGLWNRWPLKDLNDSKLIIWVQVIPLIIQDQFYTVQNLQRSPILQTRTLWLSITGWKRESGTNWPGKPNTFAKDSRTASWNSAKYLHSCPGAYTSVKMYFIIRHVDFSKVEKI